MFLFEKSIKASNIYWFGLVWFGFVRLISPTPIWNRCIRTAQEKRIKLRMSVSVCVSVYVYWCMFVCAFGLAAGTGLHGKSNYSKVHEKNIQLFTTRAEGSYGSELFRTKQK